MSLARTLAPTLEPLTLTEVKDHLRVDGTDEDALIEGLIDAVMTHIDGRDGWLGRALLTQTWEWRFDSFRAEMKRDGSLSVPLPKLQSVTSIAYIDTAGATQSWSSSLYTVDANRKPGRIVPVFGESYPTTRDVIDAVTVTFVAGFGDNPEDVPAAIRSGMLLQIDDLYCNRGTRLRQGTIANPTVSALLMPFRIWGFG